VLSKRSKKYAAAGNNIDVSLLWHRVISKPTANARAKIITNPITARIKDQLRLPEGQTGHDPLEI
jgi:hypothetical protein